MPCLAHLVHCLLRLSQDAIVTANPENPRAAEYVRGRPMDCHVAGIVLRTQLWRSFSSDFLLAVAMTKLHRNIECGNERNLNQDRFGHKRNKSMIAHSRHCKPAKCVRKLAYPQLVQPLEYLAVLELPRLACRHPSAGLHSQRQVFRVALCDLRAREHEAGGRSDNLVGTWTQTGISL
jgi:hypothetical protein